MAGFSLKRSRQAPAEETPAFGAVAERFRRAGDLDRAIALCREGLRKFPNQLSARVTLGWALLDTGAYDEARVELEQVLRRAPDNLAAIRGLAELHERAENAMPTLEASSWHRADDAKSAASEPAATLAAPQGRSFAAAHTPEHEATVRPEIRARHDAVDLTSNSAAAAAFAASADEALPAPTFDVDRPAASASSAHPSAASEPAVAITVPPAVAQAAAAIAAPRAIATLADQTVPVVEPMAFEVDPVPAPATADVDAAHVRAATLDAGAAVTNSQPVPTPALEIASPSEAPETPVFAETTSFAAQAFETGDEHVPPVAPAIEAIDETAPVVELMLDDETSVTAASSVAPIPLIAPDVTAAAAAPDEPAIVVEADGQIDWPAPALDGAMSGETANPAAVSSPQASDAAAVLAIDDSSSLDLGDLGDLAEATDLLASALGASPASTLMLDVPGAGDTSAASLDDRHEQAATGGEAPAPAAVISPQAADLLSTPPQPPDPLAEAPVAVAQMLELPREIVGQEPALAREQTAAEAGHESVFEFSRPVEEESNVEVNAPMPVAEAEEADAPASGANVFAYVLERTKPVGETLPVAHDIAAADDAREDIAAPATIELRDSEGDPDGQAPVPVFASVLVPVDVVSINARAEARRRAVARLERFLRKIEARRQQLTRASVA